MDMIAALNVVTIVMVALLTGSVMAILLRVTGFLIALTVLLAGVAGLWIWAPGQGPGIGMFITVLISLQAGYLGGTLLMAVRWQKDGGHSRPSRDHAVDRQKHS